MLEISIDFWQGEEWGVLVFVIKVQPWYLLNRAKDVNHAFICILINHFCYSAAETAFVDLRLCLPWRNSPIILSLTCSTTQRQAFLKAITRLYYLSRRVLSAFRSGTHLFTRVGITFTA